MEPTIIPISSLSPRLEGGQMARLENSVAKLDRETDVDLRSPAGKDLSRPVMLTDFWDKYADMAQLSPRMRQLEVAEAENSGSKSMNARWDERRQDILNFYGDVPDDWDRSRLERATACLLYTSPSPRDRTRSRMPSSA